MTGTLEDIGAKVGDTVFCLSDADVLKITGPRDESGKFPMIRDDGTEAAYKGDVDDWRILEEAK